MGFWNKLGKIALTAAPYVAAPFTGGASLAATGLANKAVQKWSESDAKKALGKGLAPSKFDSVLGKVGNYAALGTAFMPSSALGSVGLLGKGSSAARAVSGVEKAVQGGSKLGKVLNTANVLAGTQGSAPSTGQSKEGGGWQGTLDKVMRGANAGMAAKGIYDSIKSRQPQDDAGIGPSSGAAVGRPGFGTGGGAMPKGGFKYAENPLNQYDQTTPNLSLALHQGRQEAIRNQPFRKGYDVNYLGSDDETPLTASMPSIFSGSGGGRNKRKKAS